MELISNCRHFAVSPVKINKHIVNLVCSRCGLIASTWETGLIYGVVKDYKEAERELLK